MRYQKIPWNMFGKGIKIHVWKGSEKSFVSNSSNGRTGDRIKIEYINKNPKKCSFTLPANTKSFIDIASRMYGMSNSEFLYYVTMIGYAKILETANDQKMPAKKAILKEFDESKQKIQDLMTIEL